MSKDDTKYKLFQLRPYCGICHQSLTIRTVYTPQVNIDHILPKSQGGTNRLDNLQLAHKSCNKSKGDKNNG